VKWGNASREGSDREQCGPESGHGDSPYDTSLDCCIGQWKALAE
jgi:hypothetical protein